MTGLKAVLRMVKATSFKGHREALGKMLARAAPSAEPAEWASTVQLVKEQLESGWLKKCDHLKDNRRLCSRKTENKGAFCPPKSLP